MTSYCLIDCEINEYLDGDGCQSCSLECESCRREGDCSLCHDPLCAICSSFDNCEACAEGAHIRHKACECKKSFYRGSSGCYPCADNCEMCTAGSDLDCTRCKPGNYLQYESMTCDEHCPTGLISNEEERTCEHPLQVLTVDFTSFDHRW